jgi:cell division protein FtsQ
MVFNKFNKKKEIVRRTDEIRHRRSSRAHKVKRLNSRRTRASLPTSPPVMVRGLAGRDTSREVRNSRRKIRRRYDVVLDSRGSEMRLPSLPQVRIGWRVVSTLLVGLLAFVVYQFWNSPVYRVDEAQLSGLQRLNRKSVESVLEVVGEPIFAVNPTRIQGALLDSFPEFSSVAVKVALPDTVMITVTERVPVLIWRQGGQSDLVDADGVAFPMRDGADTSSFPVVEATGDPPPLSVAGIPTRPQTVDSISELASKLPFAMPISGGAKPLLSPEMVSAALLVCSQAQEGAPVIYHPEHGLGWKDRRGWDVYFGDVNDIAMKLLVYRAILERLKAEENRPTLVSVENVHAPYFRMEQ